MAVFTSEKILVVPDLDSYELKEGQIKGENVFDDSQINDAADAAQAAASKLIIAEGAVAAYDKNQQFFLNCDVFDTENGEGKFSYDYLIDSSLTYDLEVNGTFKSYQILLNNAKTVVSESGKLFAMGEALRVMGGTFNVQGNRAEGAADPAASDVFTGNWGIGTQAGTATQIKSGYLQINQGAKANFKDTVIFINAGWFNVDNDATTVDNDATTVTFDNTYIYLGSGGSYAPIAVEVKNGAKVTLANNSSMVYDPTFTMNITVDATSTFTLSDSKLSATSLTNDGKFTVAGKSQVVFGSQTGTIDVLDGAVLTDSKVGNVNVYGDNTWTGTNTIGDMSIGYNNSGADIVTNITGTATVTNFMIGNSKGFTSTLNIGDANGERTVINGNQHNYTTNSVVNVNKADVTGNYVSMTGLITITDSTYSKFGDFRVVSGGNHTITPGVTFVRSSIVGAYGYVGGWDASSSGYGVLSLQDNSQWKSNGGSLTTAKSVVTVDGSKFIVGGAFTHNGTLAVTGASTLDLKKVTGSGWIYMNSAKLDKNTVIKGANVRFASGENTVDGATITGGRFQVGNGVYQAEDPMVDSEKGVVVNVKNNAVIGGIDGSASPFGGWVGSAYYDEQADKDAIMTDARYTLNIDNSTAEFGYLHISHDGIMNVKGDAAELSTINATDYSFRAGFLNINGVATFDNVHAMAFNTNVSVDNATETPGKLIVTNGAVFYAKHQDSGNTSSFKISNGGIVEVSNGATFYIGQAGAALNIAAENGQLNINGATLNAGTVNNNGTITVTGKSTVQIETLTGNYVKFDGAELVGDSKIGGNARAFNDFALAGTLTVTQFNMYGNSIVKAGAVLNGSTTIVSGGSDFTLENGGEINSRFFNVIGTANIAGEINLGHSDPRQKLLQLHKGGVATIAETAVITIDGHNAIVNAGGTLNVDGTLNITKWNQYKDDPTRGGNLYNEGTLQLSENARVNISTYTSEAGSIVINVADGWSGAATIINAAEGTKDFGTIVIDAADAAAGLTYRIDEANGDLVIFNTDTEMLYLNSAYTGDFGEKVAEDKFAGINAFADIQSAVSAAQGGSKIVVESDVESAWFAQGEKVSGDLTISLADNVKPATLTANGEFRGADISANLNIGAGVTLDLAPAHSGTQNFASFSGEWNIDGTMIYGGADFDGIDLTVSETGKFLSYGTDNTSFRNGSIVNVTGTGTAEAKMGEVQFRTGQFGGFYGETTFTNSNVLMAGTTVTQMTGKVTIDNTVVNSAMGLDFGGYRGGYDDAATGTDAGFVGVITNSVITAGDLRFIGGVITITDSVIKTDADSNPNGNDGAWKNTGAFKVYKGAVVNFAGINTITVEGAVTNEGVINFTFAEEAPKANTVLIDASAASNYGTVTVTGAAAGLEAVAVGEDLYLLDMSKIYVNSAYEGLAAGAAIEGKTGVYFGINAFASFDALNDSASFGALNASVFSQGDRTIFYTYNGSNPAAKITVKNDAGTLLSYTFDNKSYNFYSGSRTHEVTLTDGGTYEFDFSKGNFSFTMVEIEKNDSEDIADIVPDSAGNVTDDVAVSEEAGNKEYTFTVAEGKLVDFVCNYTKVNGTARLKLFSVADDGTETQLSSKLFSSDGVFSVEGLEAGSYKVVFAGYGLNPDSEFNVAFKFNELDIADTNANVINPLDDVREDRNMFAYENIETAGLTNWVGTEDKVDWFGVTDIAAGTHNLGFDVEGDGLTVNLYTYANGRYSSLAAFSVTDKSDDAFDYKRSVKIAEGAELVIKVTGKGADSDYSISIA